MSVYWLPVNIDFHERTHTQVAAEIIDEGSWKSSSRPFYYNLVAMFDSLAGAPVPIETNGTVRSPQPTRITLDS